jgi:uncharacterized protein DUF3726
MTTARETEPMDPTRSGSPMPVGKSVRLSRNEIDQLCQKAARGAGMTWGLAEEAGFAATWLATRGLDGPGALLAQLQSADGRAWYEICPVVGGEEFRAAGGAQLCPIALGSTLCDHVALAVMQCDSLHVGPVTHPILLLPFLADMAQARQQSIRIDWPEGTVDVSANGHLSGDTEALAKVLRLEADLVANSSPQVESPQPVNLPLVSSDTLAALNTFAMRTTVPASAASRAGAGATGDDG